ncbi:MAG: 5'(3')-deoxyribonucleotidase [Chitinophagaceae bacterium]|nr:MAG: 5'(3')-deoxyribonucleotidase [Chitinophagaceae bacterium]
MLTLAIDMDEVLADAAKKLKAWYYRDYGKTFEDEEVKGKDLKEAVIPEHFSLFRKYCNTPGFFRDLEVMPDAQEVLKELNKQYEVYIVSAAVEFPNSLKDKYDWIMENLSFITWRQICFCGSKSIVQTDIMIDDRVRNFKDFKGRKLLYSAHHNIFETNYERVNNWKEIRQLLL